MKKWLLLVFLIFIYYFNIFGQVPPYPIEIQKDKKDLPENIKRIIQYSGTSITNVREYDRSKNETFNYFIQYVGEFWNGKNLCMIQGNVYSPNQRLLKSYYLHSNTGFSIRFYEYDSIKRINSVFLIEQIESTNTPANKNQFIYISNIYSFNDLLKDKKIIELEKTGKKTLLYQEFFNDLNILSKRIYFKNGSVYSTTLFEYNQLGKVIHEKNNTNSNDNIYNRDETFYNYPDYNTLVQYKIGFKKKNKIADTLDTKKMEYNSTNQLIGETQLNDDFVSDGKRTFEYFKYSYKYDDAGLVTEKLFSIIYSDSRSKFDGDNDLGSKTTFKYDANKYVVETLDYSFKKKTEVRQQCTYSYEYFIDNNQLH